MTQIDPQQARSFALQVVRRLRESGYEAVWAGGCVRDQLLGRCPKDYDVATNAMPEQVQQVFGRRRTLAVGASFGVIIVLGPRKAGQIDVATFRSDVSYSDGRRPDAVHYTTDIEDATRRDFTINGLFYDPIDDRVIDYVGGQADLERRLLRAIGDAELRIAEDKLRMLRAVRIAAIFELEIEESTLQAIRQHAAEIGIVSGERVAAEMRRILVHHRKAEGLRLLHHSCLLPELLPETGALEPADDAAAGSAWHRTLAVLASLGESSFPAGLAALLQNLAQGGPGEIAELVEIIGRRWRLSTAEIKRTAWLLTHEPTVRQARRRPWSELQRVLVASGAHELLQVAAAVAHEEETEMAEVEFCREKLQLPADQLNPPPLVDGQDLLRLGVPRGPVFQVLLEEIRSEQIEGRLLTKSDALDWAEGRWPQLLDQ